MATTAKPKGESLKRTYTHTESRYTFNKVVKCATDTNKLCRGTGKYNQGKQDKDINTQPYRINNIIEIKQHHKTHS
ncbi:hypothetical protein CHS0354_007677, partial [Potamilus streckersoni]